MSRLPITRFALQVLVVSWLFLDAASAHVTLQANRPLVPGRFATVRLVVPTERHVGTTQVSLEVPDAFLKAGGRLSRIQFPQGWHVEIVKEDKPSDVYSQEMKEREQRRTAQPGAELTPVADAVDENAQNEKRILDEMRKKWIKRIVFSGGSIPPDGFQEFSLSVQLPETSGEFRFAAVQTYADGKDVSWSELVEGAEHPAPTLVVAAPSSAGSGWLTMSLGAGLVFLVLIATAIARRGRSR